MAAIATGSGMVTSGIVAVNAGGGTGAAGAAGSREGGTGAGSGERPARREGGSGAGRPADQVRARTARAAIEAPKTTM
ncbi:hypothetical protein GCM10010156_70580 [Planobispora rosea]|uniref:Uncharacterized protein n=1 Tax=Planobispora rosea TaxID=35762 RepID=A0A8J3WI57_PLARO|nr:hypothetical protein GCM10010156_70580 [Planobispora rosea]GIH88531.1 hypothetical protein Pro02_69390 [Planobispora rosea]